MYLISRLSESKLVIFLIRPSDLFHSVGAAYINDRSKNVLELPLLIGGTTSRRESSANRVFADFFSFSQVQVNTTGQIDQQNTYKLGLESYKLFSAPPLTNVNLSSYPD